MRTNWKNGKKGDNDLRTAVTTKDGVLQKAVHKQLALLLSNPCHPSLNIKKMQDPRDIWEASRSSFVNLIDMKRNYVQGNFVGSKVQAGLELHAT